MKFNFKKFDQKLEEKPRLVGQISLLVFMVFFFLGFLLGNSYYNAQKRKMAALKEAQKVEETKKIEEIFAGFPEKKFLEMIKP